MKLKKILQVLLVLATVFISYGQTLRMYFWHDDYTHLYFAQEKITPDYPYHINTYIVYLINSIFGKDPFYYHLIGIILFSFTVGALYYLLSKLSFVEKNIRYLLILLFASGYVGQESLFMFAGEGAGVLTGLFLYLLTIAFFLYYHKRKDRKSLILSYLFLFLTLEVASHRFIGIIIPIAVIELIYLKRKSIKGSLSNIAGFLFVFGIQILYHPLSFVLDYGTSKSAGDTNGILLFKKGLDSTLPTYLANFGNSIIPTHLQKYILENSFLKSNFSLGLLYVLPLVALVFLSIIMHTIFNKRKYIFFYWLLVFVGSYVLTNIIDRDMLLHSALIGYSILLFLLLILVYSQHRKILLLIYSIIIGGGIGLILVKPEFYIPSDYRYMMALSYTAPLFFALIFFLVKSERKINKLRRVGLGFSYVVLVLLIFGRLYYSVTTQRVFVNKYSNTAKRIYKTILANVDEIDSPIIIFTEASEKDLAYGTGDASRVGQLPTRAAFAYNLNVPMGMIIWPRTFSNIYPIYKEKNIPLENIYSFLVTPDSVIDTSARLRDGLIWSDTLIINDLDWAPEEDGFIVSLKKEDINSLVPVTVIIKLGKATKEDSFLVEWEYDTYGSIFNKKQSEVSVENDTVYGNNIQLNIPPGGTRLENIQVKSQSGDILPLKIWVKPNQRKTVEL